MKHFPIGGAITRADLENDPHPHLHRLRATEPVAWLPVLDGWLITRHDLAVQVMRDAATFTVDHPGFSTARVVGPSMLSLDGAAHQVHRAPFERPFRKRAVTERFHGTVERKVTQLLAGFAGEEQVELRRAYAGPIAVHCMVEALGLTATPVDAVLGWYDAIVNAVTEVTLGRPIGAAGEAAFAALRASLLPALQSQPATSLLAAASGMATGLTDDQIIANAAVLLFGGIETTEGMIANACYFLLTEPAVQMAVRAQPALVAPLIEESLRLEPAAAVVDRYAVETTELAGVTIQAGDLVRVSLSGANRDPAIFPAPDQFDPNRPNLRSHVAFAQGPHVCLGLHLARLEAERAVAAALAHFPTLQLVGQAALTAAQPRGLLFRKPEALWVQGLG